MAGSHEVRGSIPLRSTKCLFSPYIRAFFYWLATRYATFLDDVDEYAGTHRSQIKIILEGKQGKRLLEILLRSTNAHTPSGGIWRAFIVFAVFTVWTNIMNHKEIEFCAEAS